MFRRGVFVCSTFRRSPWWGLFGCWLYSLPPGRAITRPLTQLTPLTTTSKTTRLASHLQMHIYKLLAKIVPFLKVDERSSDSYGGSDDFFRENLCRLISFWRFDFLGLFKFS